MSKIADAQIEQERVASLIAEGLLRETVTEMLNKDVAQPILQISNSEKQALSEAVVKSSLNSFDCI